MNLKQQILGREPKVYQKHDSRESNNYKQHNRKRKVISIETENYGFFCLICLFAAPELSL